MENYKSEELSLFSTLNDSNYSKYLNESQDYSFNFHSYYCDNLPNATGKPYFPTLPSLTNKSIHSIDTISQFPSASEVNTDATNKITVTATFHSEDNASFVNQNYVESNLTQETNTYCSGAIREENAGQISQLSNHNHLSNKLKISSQTIKNVRTEKNKFVLAPSKLDLKHKLIRNDSINPTKKIKLEKQSTLSRGTSINNFQKIKSGSTESDTYHSYEKTPERRIFFGDIGNEDWSSFNKKLESYNWSMNNHFSSNSSRQNLANELMPSSTIVSKQSDVSEYSTGNKVN